MNVEKMEMLMTERLGLENGAVKIVVEDYEKSTIYKFSIKDSMISDVEFRVSKVDNSVVFKGLAGLGSFDISDDERMNGLLLQGLVLEMFVVPLRRANEMRKELGL